MSKIAINTLPFWTAIEWTFDLRWSPSYVGEPGDGTRRVIPRGEDRNGFSYAKDANEATALEGRRATERDTPLTQKGSTRGGAIYRIFGISVTPDGGPFDKTVVQSSPPRANDGLNMYRPIPGTELAANGTVPGLVQPDVETLRGLDAALTDALLSHMNLFLTIDGTRRSLPLGPLPYYPGTGGTEGTVFSGNGLRAWDNYMQIPEGMRWNPQGSSDSVMEVSMECAYDVVMATYTAANGIDPATGEAYAVPFDRSALGRQWTKRLLVNFHGTEESPLSDVS